MSLPAGQAILRGRSIVNHYQFFYGAPETMSGFLMAAKGDRINIRYDCENHMPPIAENGGEIMACYMITGGTGRFEGATGTIIMFGKLSQTTGISDYHGEGLITY